MGRAAWAAVREARVRIAMVGHARHPGRLQRLRDRRRAPGRALRRPRPRGDRLLPHPHDRAAGRPTPGRGWCTCRRSAASTSTRSPTRCVSTAHLAVRERPDVAIYFIAGNAPAVPLARLAGIPAILQIDGLDSERAKWSGPARAYLRLAERLAPAAATLAVTDSEAVADAYERRYGRRIAWIPYGAELPDPGDAGWCRRLGRGARALRAVRGPPGAREQRPPAGGGAPPAGDRTGRWWWWATRPTPRTTSPACARRPGRACASPATSSATATPSWCTAAASCARPPRSAAPTR